MKKMKFFYQLILFYWFLYFWSQFCFAQQPNYIKQIIGNANCSEAIVEGTWKDVTCRFFNGSKLSMLYDIDPNYGIGECESCFNYFLSQEANQVESAQRTAFRTELIRIYTINKTDDERCCEYIPAICPGSFLNPDDCVIRVLRTIRSRTAQSTQSLFFSEKNNDTFSWVGQTGYRNDQNCVPPALYVIPGQPNPPAITGDFCVYINRTDKLTMEAETIQVTASESFTVGPDTIVSTIKVGTWEITPDASAVEIWIGMTITGFGLAKELIIWPSGTKTPFPINRSYVPPSYPGGIQAISFINPQLQNMVNFSQTAILNGNTVPVIVTGPWYYATPFNDRYFRVRIQRPPGTDGQSTTLNFEYTVFSRILGDDETVIPPPPIFPGVETAANLLLAYLAIAGGLILICCFCCAICRKVIRYKARKRRAQRHRDHHKKGKDASSSSSSSDSN